MELIRQIKETVATKLPTAEAKKKTSVIYWDLMRQSSTIGSPNFSRIDQSDLAHLFELYDDQFFSGQLKRSLNQLGHPLSFRLSTRMTRAGGKTTREETWNGRKLRDRKYEIAISTTLLFQTFQNDRKPVNVTGIICSDRMQALQRIMEHEIIHLVEMMVWYHSDCFRNRFKTITSGLFTHTESTHQLTTGNERAFTEFGIKVGDAVKFRHENVIHQGMVNRITKRATVLVKNNRGQKFSDGNRYLRFYVPLQDLILDEKSRPGKRSRAS